MAIVLTNGNLLEGDATTASKVTYVVTGLDGTTLIRLASGQLPNSKGTLYTAVGTDTIASITIFNTNTTAEAVNLYLQDGTASRQMVGIDALGAGYHALFDGNRLTVCDNNGAIQYTIVSSVTGVTLDTCVGKGTWTASGTWTLPAMTLGGLAVLSENITIALAPLLTAGDKWCGILDVPAGTSVAGVALAFGEVCYFDVSTSKWKLAKADVAATAFCKLAMCVLAASGVDQPTSMLLYGKVRADTKFPTLTVSAPAFLSAATAGLITNTPPVATNNAPRIMGYGNTTHELFFTPDQTYLEHI